MFFPRFWIKLVLPHLVCPKTSLFPVNFPSYEYFSISILNLKCTIELFELSLFLNFPYQLIKTWPFIRQKVSFFIRNRSFFSSRKCFLISLALFFFVLCKFTYIYPISKDVIPLGEQNLFSFVCEKLVFMTVFGISPRTTGNFCCSW